MTTLGCWLEAISRSHDSSGRPVNHPKRRLNTATVLFDGAKLMTGLTDLLDPDQWLASGKKLSDFPLPHGAKEREAVRLILSERPELLIKS